MLAHLLVSSGRLVQRIAFVALVPLSALLTGGCSGAEAEGPEVTAGDGAVAASGAALAAPAAGVPTCNDAQATACDCPSGYYCCPSNALCFEHLADIAYSACRSDRALACFTP